MFAVGHLAFGYLSGRASSKLLGVDTDIPFLLFFSMLPDIDLLTLRFGLTHRGSTHSLIVLSLLFLPIVLVLKKRAIPYLVGMIQHSLLGDLFTGGAQLFWPLSFEGFGISSIETTSMISIVLEWAAFLGAMLLMLRINDLRVFVTPHKANLALSVPLGFVSFSLLTTLAVFPGLPRIVYYFHIPTFLIIPHVAFFILFTLALFVDLRHGARVLVKRVRPNSSSP